MAEANGNEPECDTCTKGPEPEYSSPLNYEALRVWHELDLFGRDIDSYCGMPKPLKLDAIIAACRACPDPAGLKWRIMFIEEKIFSKRIKKFNADMARRNKGKK